MSYELQPNVIASVWRNNTPEKTNHLAISKTN